MESDPAPYGFAIMNEANQPLLDMFNAGLADIKANGTYDEILAKYLGEQIRIIESYDSGDGKAAADTVAASCTVKTPV